MFANEDEKKKNICEDLGKKKERMKLQTKKRKEKIMKFLTCQQTLKGRET